MISNQWDVVRVPFPFTDRAAVKKRPALVLSKQSFNSASGHSVMAMITKRDNSGWPQDYDVRQWAAAGLKLPSWIRMKIFTIENTLVLDKLGTLQATDVTGFRSAATTAMW
jgi:mRNA interferase MazF